MRTRVDGVDEKWLARASVEDPAAHAYALWDLRHEPDRVRFASCRAGDETLAYRLEWRGPLHPPVIHWVGSPAAPELLEDWPERPFVGVVPPELVGALRELRGPIVTYPVELQSLRGRVAGGTGSIRRGRRLGPSDRDALAELLRTERDRLLEGYQGVELDRIPCFGAFDGPRLVAVAKASVTLPRVWMLTGIVTAASRRGEGFGRAATEAAARAAVDAGARPALYVRSDNLPAVRLYASLGFRRESAKVWVDAGANWPP